MDAYGVGKTSTEHPRGGNVDNIVQIDLPNEMLQLVLDTGAEVDVIHSEVPADADDAIRETESGTPVTPATASLNEIGDVGAVLRYAVDETEPA